MTTPKELRPLEEFLAPQSEEIRTRIWSKLYELLERPEQLKRLWLADRPDVPDRRRLEEIVWDLADEIGPAPGKTLRGPAQAVRGNVVELKEWVGRKLSPEAVPEPPEADSSVKTWLKPWKFQPLASWTEVQPDDEQRIVLITAEAVGTILNEGELGLLPPRVLESLKSPGVKLRLPLNYLRDLVARSMNVAYTVDAPGICVTAASRGVEDFLPEVSRPILGKPIWFLSNLVESRFLSKEHRAQFVKTQNDLVKLAEQGEAVFPDVEVFLRNDTVRRDEWRGVCRVEVHAVPVYTEKGELLERLITVRIEREGRTEAELKAVDIYKAFRDNALASTSKPRNGILRADMPSLAYTHPISTEHDVAEKEALAAIAGTIEGLRREDPFVENLRKLKKETRKGLMAAFLATLSDEEFLEIAGELGERVERILQRYPGAKNVVVSAAMRVRGSRGGTERMSKLSEAEIHEVARTARKAREKKGG